MNTIVSNEFTTRAMLALYLREAKYEFLRVLRTPAFSVPTLVFAPMFYLMFGVLLNRGNAQAASYLMATYSVFGVMGPGLFGFGVGLAMDRERGLLTLKRVQPVPALAPLLAKVGMSMLFAACIGVMLLVLGVSLGGVHLTASQAARFLGNPSPRRSSCQRPCGRWWSRSHRHTLRVSAWGCRSS